MRSKPRLPARALATSPFVREPYVAPTTADFQVGDRVTLDSRGMGRVIEVTEEYVIVDFGSAGRGRISPGAKGFSRL
jgi:hypothetical protein